MYSIFCCLNIDILTFQVPFLQKLTVFLHLTYLFLHLYILFLFVACAYYILELPASQNCSSIYLRRFYKMDKKKHTKKCAICSNTHDCINYKETFICEDCLGYIAGLDPIQPRCAEKSCDV